MPVRPVGYKSREDHVPKTVMHTTSKQNCTFTLPWIAE